MKPKPIVTSGYIIAAFDGERPRFLCREAKHGHWVVTYDHQKATVLDGEDEALQVLRDCLRRGFGRNYAAGDWRPYAVTSKSSFFELAHAAA